MPVVAGSESLGLERLVHVNNVGGPLGRNQSAMGGEKKPWAQDQ